MFFLSSDVGGTFVDLVLFDATRGRIFVHKVPSTGESAEGILQGVSQILKAADVSIADVARFVHGTTIATNAWLTHRGGRVLFLVTAGFKDLLEIGTQRRPELYSLTQTRPAALAPRSQAIEVRERLDAFGTVVAPLSQKEVHRVVETIRTAAPQSIAISLLFSYLNDRHEAQLAQAIRDAFPDLPVYVSSEINPEIGEYARTNTTVAAAYVGPVIDHYVASLEEGLARAGFSAPLMLMRSDDGVATTQAARRNPATMLLSGPAGGVIAAASLGDAIGADDLITFDMGGTSADFSLIAAGKPHISTERSLDGQPLRLPMLDIETISAGGGSIASVDHAGALQVGPQSAGANPGPACYGRGGTQPTLTDATLVLGIVSPDDFAGGLRLSLDLARKAIEDCVARPLNISIEQAALGMISVACAQMRQAIRGLSIERGYDIRRFSLLAFGGAGPIFGALMASDLRVEQLLIPPRPGVFAATGLLLADIKHNLQTPYSALVSKVDEAELRERLRALEGKLNEALEADRILPPRRSFRFSVDLRYVGQFHDITAPIQDPRTIGWWSADAVAAHFHELHERVYGHADRRSDVEIVNIRGHGLGEVDKPSFPPIAGCSQKTGPRSFREILLDRRSERLQCPVYSRSDLTPGDRLEGPAVVSQSDTTVLVLPQQRGEVDEYGVIHIRMKDPAK